jgi:FkbM family methyltransferase
MSPPSAARLRRARLAASLWRFQTLRRARRLFAGTAGPCILDRPFFGARLFLDVSRSDAQRLLYLEGERFLGERFLLRRLVRPGARIADVGANIGYYLLFWRAAAGPTAAIDCFEPDPDNLAELERNRRENAIDGARVFPVAVGARDGEASIASGINAVVQDGGSGAHRVPLRRLDSLLPGPVDLLKIDVEGYEGRVLAGAGELLSRRRPTVVVEMHPAAIAPPDTAAGIAGELAELYPRLAAFAPRSQAGLGGKLAARYGGPAAVARVSSLAALLAACAEGRRREPFWLVGWPEKVPDAPA